MLSLALCSTLIINYIYIFAQPCYLPDDFFSDYFKVPAKALENYTAFDISLVTGLLFFIDLLLLF